MAFAAALPTLYNGQLVRTLPVVAEVDDDLNASADSDEYFVRRYNGGYYGAANYNRGYPNYNLGYASYNAYPSYSNFGGYRYARSADLDSADARNKAHGGNRRGYGGERGAGHGGGYDNNRRGPQHSG